MVEERKSHFQLALEARQGKIKPELLPKAARQLYNDKTMTPEQLGEYINIPAAKQKGFLRRRIRPKLG